MRRLLVSVGIIIAASSQPSLAKEPSPVPAPAEPDWSTVRQVSEAYLKSQLIDPDSAKIKWTHSFRWNSFKPGFKKRIWAWSGCGVLNAKNRMGGYTGDSPFVIYYNEGIQYAYIGDADSPIVTYCENNGRPPLQASFVDTPGEKTRDQFR